MSMLSRALRAALLGLLAVGVAAADGPGPNARANNVFVVTHLDIIPDFVGQAEPVLRDFVQDSRGAPGVLVFKMVSWTPTTNHFQLIEVFDSQRSFDAFVSLPRTIQFRHDLAPFIGAPYDERVYRYTSNSGAIEP